MIASAVSGSARAPPVSFSRGCFGTVQTPSTMSSHFIDATFRLRCAGQETQAHDRGECAGLALGRLPDGPDLAVVKNPRPRCDLLPFHTFDDRRAVVVAAAGVPEHDRADDVEHIVRRPRAVLSST